MDAFYASVEQRDNPDLRNKPVVVAWRGPRSVVCAASYQARQFGIHSAMPAVHAERLCPQAVFVPPDFPRYQAVSQQIHAIFARYTDLIEPLSLDEAYLDVTLPPIHLPTATKVAQAIRTAIRNETGLTASAGVAPNKFIAKIASDWRKPDGLTVVTPACVDAFLVGLPVRKLPGVGKVTNASLAELNVTTVDELRRLPLPLLVRHFGRNGRRLHERARGVDDAPVRSHRPTVQVSSETTFEHDLMLDQLAPYIRQLAAKAWAAAGRENNRVARTVVLKLKTADFRTLTRSTTATRPPNSAAEVARLACALRQRVRHAVDKRYRLVGVGLSGFVETAATTPQGELFD